MPASRALKHVKDETAVSDAALQRVAASRPVILNRAPSLHKHSILAFNPVIHEGKGIQLNPLVVGGFNADFDGDTMAIHTPVENEAVSEAKTLYPSKNIFKNGDNAIVPSISQEYLLGTYYLSEIKPGTGKIFNSVDDAKDAKTP
ncbi:hypothetical protein H8D85_01980 [bacterium]|nr:hypothetical protein [bacterium]